MKGTEKQIKWAEDIIAKVQNCIAANIENCKGNKALEPEIPAWEYMAQRFEAVLASQPKMSDAAFIINNRSNIVFHPIDLMQEIGMTRDKFNMEWIEAAKKVLG